MLTFAVWISLTCCLLRTCHTTHAVPELLAFSGLKIQHPTNGLVLGLKTRSIGNKPVQVVSLGVQPPLNIAIYNGTNIHRHEDGFVALLSNGDKNMAITHADSKLLRVASLKGGNKKHTFAFNLRPVHDSQMEFQLFTEVSVQGKLKGYLLGYYSKTNAVLLVEENNTGGVDVNWRVYPWNCPAGYFYSDNACLLCAVKTYKPSSGNHACLPCSSNQLSTGATVCPTITTTTTTRTTTTTTTMKTTTTTTRPTTLTTTTTSAYSTTPSTTTTVTTTNSNKNSDTTSRMIPCTDTTSNIVKSTDTISNTVTEGTATTSKTIESTETTSTTIVNHENTQRSSSTPVLAVPSQIDDKPPTTAPSASSTQDQIPVTDESSSNPILLAGILGAGAAVIGAAAALVIRMRRGWLKRPVMKNQNQGTPRQRSYYDYGGSLPNLPRNHASLMVSDKRMPVAPIQLQQLGRMGSINGSRECLISSDKNKGFNTAVAHKSTRADMQHRKNDHPIVTNPTLTQSMFGLIRHASEDTVETTEMVLSTKVNDDDRTEIGSVFETNIAVSVGLDTEIEPMKAVYPTQVTLTTFYGK